MEPFFWDRAKFLPPARRQKQPAEISTKAEGLAASLIPSL
jgi:hypothetical protein